jgi:hypothetical protein
MNFYLTKTLMFTDVAKGIPDIPLGSLLIEVELNEAQTVYFFKTIDNVGVTVGSIWKGHYLTPLKSNKLLDLLFL